ncbi:HlyD family secretion protein [Crenobacter cavernae]|uniref:HlyD family efflux transporter periplasmic adaptor subunit n=1 Tax=Crenobacter cavernae TaxID=2290923 RepID=A0ABY0FIM3_9NEIS|nr:HlyD family efflux transporter periplasmic adaptor subunit [Crenobacter cavernae]RXZ45377.1 HlyD family efflux transporter periplasmic adaptor subunit [Crenobacter cavernae]
MSARAVIGMMVLALVAGCSETPDEVFPGYVEGEYLRVAAPFAGALTRLSVKRGDTVAAGKPLFALESENERAAREQAVAQLARTQSALDDLLKGKRPPELAAARAQLAQAEASLAQSRADLKRDETLVGRGFISSQQLDRTRAAYERDKAAVAQLAAQLDVARLAGREDQIAAARHDVDAARDALAQAEWQLGQKSQNAPEAGLVADTLFVAGEWVPAGSPVVSILPPANIKLRFFVPETRVGSLKTGQAVTVRCDGCAAAISAKVSFIAPQAEYTPPVIYSRENRAKLVFLVEARPRPSDAVKLHPGQPVEVTLGQPADTQR